MNPLGKVFRCLLFMMANRMDDLLTTYERSTPSIDQTVVTRTLGTIQLARRIAATLVVMLIIGTTACRRKDENGNPVVGGTPGQGVTTMAHYGGTTSGWPCGSQTCRQTIATDADVIDYPTDQVDVYLCRNTDCSTGNLPALQCSQTNGSATDACYTTTPTPYIVYGKDLVQLINANEPNTGYTPTVPGFSTYYIKTIVTR